MTNLKTLENFNKEGKEIYSDLEDEQRFHIVDTICLNLKQEAINHIKEIRSKNIDWEIINTYASKFGGKKPLLKANLRSEFIEVVNWIKYFFNIKEEEL